MNAAVTFQIGLNESARAIRGKFTFAGAWESCCRMRTEVTTDLDAITKPIWKTLINNPITMASMSLSESQTVSMLGETRAVLYGDSTETESEITLDKLFTLVKSMGSSLNERFTELKDYPTH